MKKNVLVVAAHPDDEVLGCGGTIAKHIKAGDEVYFLIIADGVTSRKYDPERQITRESELKENKQELKRRKLELVKAAKVLGVREDNLFVLDLPDQRLDTVPLLNIIKKIELVRDKISPELVYTHHWGDLNIDHRLVFEAVLVAFRPNPNKKVEILCFEIPGSTNWGLPIAEHIFKPGFYVNISDSIDQKIEALEMYESEKCEEPHPRSSKAIRQLAKMRGRPKGFEYAEAFVRIVRENSGH